MHLTLILYPLMVPEASPGAPCRYFRGEWAELANSYSSFKTQLTHHGLCAHLPHRGLAVNHTYPTGTACSRPRYQLVAPAPVSLLAWTPADMRLLFHIPTGHVFQGTPAALAPCCSRTPHVGATPGPLTLPFPPLWKTAPTPLHGSLPHQLWAQMSPPQRALLKIVP